jgi:hypothetical protein
MLVHNWCQSHWSEQARRAIQITRELLVGTTVLVRNKRGTQISARVVSQINAEQGLLRYGIQFVEEDIRSATFWGITFPTA